MKYLPLSSLISSDTYSGAFMLGSIAAALSASTAIYYSLAQKEKINECDKLLKKSIYCSINNKSIGIAALNIFIKTLIVMMAFSYILFIIFGYGGGSINNYYKPKIITIKKGILHIFSLFIIYFFFHYFAGYYITKKIQPVKHVLKGSLYDLGISRNLNLENDKENNKKNDKKKNYMFIQTLLIIVFVVLIFVSIRIETFFL